MGRLEDIVERNERALAAMRNRRSYFGLILDFVRHVFDPDQPPDERKRRVAALAITLGLVAAAVAGVLVWLHGRGDATREHDIAQRAGSIVTDRDGHRVKLATLWRERPAIIVFYPVFSCERCAAQLQELGTLGREHHVAVAAVAFDSDRIDALSAAIGPQVSLYMAPLASFLKPWKIPWQSTDDTGPAMYVVAPDGEVTYRRTCHDFVHCSPRAELEPAFAAPAGQGHGVGKSR